ncbi:acyl-CoA dehydrogenase family protein [Rhodococcus sp. NPDC058514]|uniref:acyl-CoA dehydrogenase family protein n=1 Tax=unclassified Rhodococcus (in: high G+C Gram-positive bacteria) TaxID=192944 RepID=UPI0036466801
MSTETATISSTAFLDGITEVLSRATPLVEQHEVDGTYPHALARELLGTGIARLILDPPRELENPAQLFCTSVEAIAHEWVALAESIHLQTLAACAVFRFGSPALLATLGPGLAAGSVLAANCIGEDNAGSDIAAIALTARREGDGFLMSGTKTWVGHAPIAGLLNVYARTSDAGMGGITCFLVDADSPGIEIGPPAAKLAAGALPTADITFTDTPVPAERMLGRLNRGARVAELLLTQGRIGLAACALGLGQAAMDRAVEFAKRRRQFGSEIINYQGVSFLLADMATQLQAARQLLLLACREIDTGGPSATLLCAQAKLFATDTAMKVTTDAVQVLGATAYKRGEAVERWMREAKLLQILQGTNQIQRQTIVSRL